MVQTSNMWDQRYAIADYVYGKEPNGFFEQELLKLSPGKILLPAEGEGRNAVFAALHAWDVYAFDSSVEARKKAEKFAEEKNVHINYFLSSYEEFTFAENSFDAVVLIFAHSVNRRENHRKLVRFLKPGGTLLLEGFSKNQFYNNTGGPQKIELLFSEEELKNDFSQMSNLTVYETEKNLDEGKHHSGTASVIRLIGEK